MLDRIIEEAPDHLRPGGFLLIVSSSVLGTDRTLGAMRDAGLEDAECIARRRGPLGPLMRTRVHMLEERGMLAPGQREEDVIILPGAPARTSAAGACPTDARARRFRRPSGAPAAGVMNARLNGVRCEVR